MLQAVIESSELPARSLSAPLAQKSAPSCPSSLLETIADDAGRAGRNTADWDIGDAAWVLILLTEDLRNLNLRLKSHHINGLQYPRQQLMTEAPHKPASSCRELAFLEITTATAEDTEERRRSHWKDRLRSD